MSKKYLFFLFILNNINNEKVTINANSIIDRSTLSVKDFTKKVGVNRSSYHLWKTKKTVPKKTTINKIAQVLKINLKWLDEDDVIIINDKK